jgi:transcriptional regulator with XRE-family HTH domain
LSYPAFLSQKEVAKLLGTSQQQVSRLESASYDGHSLKTLRRLAKALNAKVKVVFEPLHEEIMQVAEESASYSQDHRNKDGGKQKR